MIGGRILKRLGRAVVGRVVTRIQGEPSGGLLARLREARGEPALIVPVNPTAPAIARGYDPPEWLVIVLSLIVALIDRFTGR